MSRADGPPRDRPEPKRREPWTADVPSREDVLRKLSEGTADLLYLSAFCRNNAGGAALVIQHLDGSVVSARGTIASLSERLARVDPAEIRRVTEREGNGE